MASNEMKAKSSHAAKMLSEVKRTKGGYSRGEEGKGKGEQGTGIKGQATINIETVIAG